MYPTMFVAGKLLVGGTALQSKKPVSQLFVQVLINGTPCKMLVDTGAELSILDASCFQSLSPTHPAITIKAIGGNPIPTQGSLRCNAVIGPYSFMHTFTLASANVSILGLDFLASHDLEICIGKRRLTLDGSFVTDLVSNVKGIRTTCHTSVHTLDHINIPRPYIAQTKTGITHNIEVQLPKTGHIPPQYQNVVHNLISDYKDIFAKGSFPTPNHQVAHAIATNGNVPNKAKVYPIPLNYHDELKSKLEEWLSAGIIVPSCSPYASPMVVVKKKDGSIRPCVDFRALNAVTSPDLYQLPKIQDLLQYIHGSYFSTLDLRDAYFQIPVARKDRHKTAVRTPFGSYHFTRMPFGLRNAAPTFQRFIDVVLRGLGFAKAYIDDVVVYSDTAEDHIKHLHAIFSRLKTWGLRVNGIKSNVFDNKVKFLGFEINSEGYRPGRDCVSNIELLSTPMCRQDVQKIVGIANFYRNHVPDLAQDLSVIQATSLGKTKFQWSLGAKTALERLKSKLSNRTSLKPVMSSTPFDLFTDASGIGLGGALFQQGKPVGYFSRKLSETETRYSTFDREALAMVAAIKYFRHFILNAKVTVWCDHKPLEPWLSKPPTTDRHARWLTQVQEIDMTIKHISGMSNALADSLSRPKLKQIACVAAIAKLPQVPINQRSTLMAAAHGLGHAGIRRTLSILRTRGFWKGMARDVKQWIQGCHPCQAMKNNHNVTRQPMHFPPTSRFSTVHVDIVGPLPPSHSGARYLLTMIDHYTKWAEAVPLQDISAESCAREFFSTWVARYGIPEILVSDQGVQFESQLFKSLMQRLGIKRQRTTTYHPQSNGMVERWHRTLKESLRCCMLENSEDWEFILPQVLLAYRSTANAQGFAPCTLLFGEPLTLPVDLCCSSAPPIGIQPEEELVKKIRLGLRRAKIVLSSQLPVQTRSTPTHKHTVGSWVYARIFPERKGLNPRYSGPYLIKDIQGVTATIIRNGGSQVVNIDNLKLATDPTSLNHQTILSPTVSAANDCLPGQSVQTGSMSQLPTSSRNGRIIKLPARFVD